MEIRGGLAEGGVYLCGRLWGSGGSKVWHLANHFHRGMAVWIQIWSSTNLLLQYMVGYHALPQSRGRNLPEAVWVYYLEISRLRQRRHAPGASSLLHIGVWVAREVETQNQAVGRPWWNHSHRSCRLLSWYETLDLLLPTDTSTGCLVPAAANSTRTVHSRFFGTRCWKCCCCRSALRANSSGQDVPYLRSAVDDGSNGDKIGINISMPGGVIFDQSELRSLLSEQELDKLLRFNEQYQRQ